MAGKKLNVIISGDSAILVKDIPTDKLLKRPEIKIVENKSFEKGLYTKKAIVDFYFFKKIPVKVTRKYRYHREKRMWERYFNEYRFFSDSLLTQMQ